jgi:hypothetical protein
MRRARDPVPAATGPAHDTRIDGPMNPVSRADRLQLRLPITYRARGDEDWLLSRVVNLSESGVLFGPTDLPPGTAVEVIISPPLAVGGRAAGPHVCGGRIVRATEAGDVAAQFETWRVLLEA